MSPEVGIVLLQFRVKNYRSIGDEITIDLTAGKGREHADFLINNNGVKVLPVISMYGNNASGKSNIIQAFHAMFINMFTSYTYGNSGKFHATPFLFDDALSKEPTECEIFFCLGMYEYQYGYKATNDRVYEEWLYYRKQSSRDTVVKTVFERAKGKIEFFGVYKKFSWYQGFVDKNGLVLSLLGNRKAEKPTKSEKIFIDIAGWARNNFFCSVIHDFDENKLNEFYCEMDELKKLTLEILQEFDPSIKDIDVKKKTNTDGESVYEVFTKHREEWYPLNIESVGTQKLFTVSAGIMLALRYQSTTLVYDELDNCLHPLILRRIVAMFHDKEVNIMNSQLIFTSHNLTLLNRNELRRDEIWFVEKNENEFTTAYSLDSFKSTADEVRADLDYGKHYLSGRFGAVPYLNKKGKG